MSVLLPFIFMLLLLHAATVPRACAAQDTGDATIAPDYLRCEYLVDPLGIDVRRPRLSWIVEATDPGLRGRVQTAYRILIASTPEALARDEGDLWDTGKVVSDESMQIEYAGRALASRDRAFWKVRLWDNDDRPSAWSETASWSMGLLEPSDWTARWIGDETPATPYHNPLPAPMLRREFRVDDLGTMRRATVYVTALGLYELHINGERVGDHVLAPEWTDYHSRIQYQTYDVTDLLRRGGNTIGAMLGDGWYAGSIGLTWIVPDGPRRAIYGRRPALLLQLEIEFDDGDTQTIVSDGTWRSTIEGPIRIGDLLDGCLYDARREMPGWDDGGFDDSAWVPVRVDEPPAAALVAQRNQPIRITRTLRPVALTEPAPNTYIFDMGQNMVGRCRLALSAPAGTTITLRHAEMLNPDGSLYTDNLRGAAQTQYYIAHGDGREIFQPRFTYHGFRYVEVRDLPKRPALDDLVGCVLRSASPEVGQFECSNPLLNRLMQNIIWTQRANMHGIPTDCPQRDERLGWMGDILAFAQTACFNMDMSAFLGKWLTDVRDAQAADGRFPDFAPHPFNPNVRFSGAPGWADAGVIVPWRAYCNYGDVRILEESYDAARRWIEFVRQRNPDLIWRNARGNDYGDWLNADTLKLDGWPSTGAQVPRDLFATAMFAHSTRILSEMATVLGRVDETQEYASLAADIRAAFNRAYVRPDGSMVGDTQAGYALALHFDLLPEAVRAAAAQRMVDRFAPYDGHISTGFHSTCPLMLELSRNGRLDEAFRLINMRTMPSWGYAIEHGATTIWERWDGYVEGRGFQDPGMNSFNHYALGAVGEWMYRTIIGINSDPQTPAFKHIIIRPQPGGGLTWATGSHDSIRGRISCSWKIVDGRITIETQIPANTSALVRIPTLEPEAVTESGRPAAAAPGVARHAVEQGAALYRVGSGRYVFEAPYDEAIGSSADP